ncbi:MAG: DUF5678 domain-containing protein [Nitrososphaerales archaeon]
MPSIFDEDQPKDKEKMHKDIFDLFSKLTNDKIDLTTEDRFEQEESYFHKVKPKLLTDKTLVGKYVAIVGQKMVDSDKDESELVKRVYQKYGYIPAYIERLGKEEEHIIEYSSPEFQ